MPRKNLGMPIAMIVSGLCLIAFGLFWGSAIKREFIFGGAIIAALGGWLLVETRI
jgi:hypothetical protein